MAQDNNHGISEAIALFMGGIWLIKQKEEDGQKFFNNGNKHLEERVNSLISLDGSFSQHSINYHRVLIELLCFVEYWRNLYSLKLFTKNFYYKVDRAINWFEQFLD